MTDLKPHYIVVNDPDDKLDVINLVSTDLGRSVDVTPRPWSPHTFQALISDAEVIILQSDPRILVVEPDPTIYKNIGLTTKGVRTGIFSCNPNVNNPTDKNYGLDRCTTSTNNFAGESYVSANTQFTYNLDGTGVDIVVIDTGVEAGHPEFAVNANGTGGTRVVNYDWTQLGIIPNVPTGGFLGDCDGHGSNCASIAAGNTQGWAPGAAIYSLRCIGTGAATEKDILTGATLGLVDILEAFESVTAFHNAKHVTSTGYKRPTIVSCSFGYDDYYYGGQMQTVNYRGTTHSLTTTTGNGATLYGTIGEAQGGDGSFGYRYATVEAAITTCLQAGVIIVGAAGNNAHKIDVSGGQDYNNYIIQADQPGVQRPYHRGMTPSAVTGVICVGAQDSIYTPYDSKAFFSCAGPRVDIFAPGTGVMGAYSSGTYYVSAIRDPRNSNYWLNKISGTSQATPQVSGVAACVLQARPWMTNTNLINFLSSVSLKNALNQNALVGNSYGFSSTGTYTNLSSLQNAPNHLLQQPFVLPTPLTIS